MSRIGTGGAPIPSSLISLPLTLLSPFPPEAFGEKKKKKCQMITLLWAPSGSSCTYSTHHTSLTFLPTFYTTVVHLTLCSAGWKSMGATHNGSSICLTVEGTATSGHDQKRMHNRYGLQLNGFQMYPNVSTWVTLQGYNLGGNVLYLKLQFLKFQYWLIWQHPCLCWEQQMQCNTMFQEFWG